VSTRLRQYQRDCTRSGSLPTGVAGDEGGCRSLYSSFLESRCRSKREDIAKTGTRWCSAFAWRKDGRGRPAFSPIRGAKLDYVGAAGNRQARDVMQAMSPRKKEHMRLRWACGRAIARWSKTFQSRTNLPAYSKEQKPGDGQTAAHFRSARRDHPKS